MRVSGAHDAFGVTVVRYFVTYLRVPEHGDRRISVPSDGGKQRVTVMPFPVDAMVAEQTLLVPFSLELKIYVDHDQDSFNEEAIIAFGSARSCG
jgi:hypothetical protein